MERIISDEEKLRRAIEISERRNKSSGTYPKTTRVNLNEPKSRKLFKRMAIQMLISLLVYGIFYITTTSSYFFSKPILETTSFILNYDINFQQLYEQGKERIEGFLKTQSEEKREENVVQENAEIVNETANIAKTTLKKKTQMEIDAEEVKKMTTFQVPLKGKITSEFGVREVTSPIMSDDHKGIDIAAKEGTNIRSSISGQVEEAGKNSEYGNYIKIKQRDIITVYAHCKKLKVKKGKEVKQGDVIATVGSTGKSTGPHLHFEIRLSGRYINPRYVIHF